jgi:carotenoid cleavage dioxygenase
LKPFDLRDSGFHGHVAGCYENEDGHVVFDLTVADDNVFFFFPPDNAPRESLQKRNKLTSDTFRWIFDPKAKTNSHVKPARLFGISGEFSRIDDRFCTKKYNHFWQLQIDPTKKYDFEKCGSPAGGLFNAIGHFTWDEGTKDVYWAGPTTTFQEPVFVPRNTDVEGDGYLMCLLNHLDVLRNDILIFDALHLAKGRLARIEKGEWGAGSCEAGFETVAVAGATSKWHERDERSDSLGGIVDCRVLNV